MQITFDTDNAKDRTLVAALLKLNLAPAGDAQPEVAQNTGSTATGSNPLPEGSGVTGEAASATAAASSAPVKEKKPKKTATENVSKDEPKIDTSEAAVETSDKPLTLDEVRAALQTFTASKGVPAGIELLKEFGAGRVSELDAGKYANFVAKCAA